MAFFEDDNHRLHGGRIAGVLYILALGPWFGGNFLSDGLSPMGLARIGFTAGWWLAFCDKQSPRLSQLFDVRHTVGVIMTAFGLAAQFYLLAKK